MKFAICIATDSDVFAGTERHMMELARGLRELAVPVSIVCPVPSPLAEHAAAEGISVFGLTKGWKMRWQMVALFRRLLASGQVQIIHAHNGWTAFAAAIAQSMAGVGSVVTTQHFLKPAHVSRRGLSAIVSGAIHRWVNAKTGHVIAISKATESASSNRGEVARDRITVIPNGIRPVNGSDLHPQVVRDELKLEPGQPLIVAASRLEAEKDIPILVDAMADVIRRFPTACCVIAGVGSQRSVIESQIARIGLEHQIRLLGFRDDVLSIISAGDVFVLPSRAEPFGLVLLEAMSIGVPVVATAAGGPAEIVVHEQTGLLVGPQDSRSLSQSICRLLADLQLRDALSHAAQQRFEQHYTADIMARGTLEVYRHVLNQGVAAVSPESQSQVISS